MPNLSGAFTVLLVSLSGIPITLLCNYFSTILSESAIFLIGVLSLCAIVAVVHALRDKSRPVEPLYYVFTLCCFSSVVDLLISLENDGFIKGFVEFYLKKGEPYLQTAHGNLICYWDGTVHLGMYLTLLAAMAWGQSYRTVGLVWCGSILNSLIVFLPGNFLGNHEVKLSYLLNVPFIIVPVYSLYRFLKDTKTEPVITADEAARSYQPLGKRPLDIICFGFCIVHIAIGLFRGCVALSTKEDNLFAEYIRLVEPYIGDPVFYPKLQMLAYAYYLIPFWCQCLYGLVVPGKYRIRDWSLFVFGAVAQGQFSHIGASLNLRTAAEYRIQSASLPAFWSVNLGLVVGSALLAYRCHNSVHFFRIKGKRGSKSATSKLQQNGRQIKQQHSNGKLAEK